MNEHSTAWCSMWGTGRYHQQEDRVIQSKTSKGENRAKLYLAYKDHKKESFKTRPIGTACTSNTRAFANSVSDFLESVANSEEHKYEVISTEDLLHHIMLHNKKVEQREKERETLEKKRWDCWKEKLWNFPCTSCSLREKAEEKDIAREQPGQGAEATRALEEEGGEEKVITDIVNDLIAQITAVSTTRKKRMKCSTCMDKIRMMMKEDCECGKATRSTELAMVGMDAVALFPSLTSRRTAGIVRDRVRRSKMKMSGFNWKKGMIYIKANLHLKISLSKSVRRFLPLRKSNQGVEPGMGSKGLKNKDGSENLQWYFPRNNPSEEEVKEMISIVAQIAIITLWENYLYDFGGETHAQSEGGPIGQRPTMAASRIVIHQFFEDYERILTKAELEITLLKVYVDDGRQITSLLKKGSRYCHASKEFKWSKEDEEEDEKMEQEGETKGGFMARLCLPAMNDINPDLTFTAEVEEDFSTKKLPTLDTVLWMKDDGRVLHGYYEKEMKSQLMLEKNSAMGIKQKHCIMANELSRRLYNLDSNNEDLEAEVEEVIETYTRQCKNSGWERKEVREMVVNGYIGWQRRLTRR